jgi:dihydroxyacetone kinase-like predicted kinase
MLVHDPSGDLTAVAAKMSTALTTVKTGEITVATRACLIDGVSAEGGQAIGLLDGRLVNAADTVEQAVLDLLKKAKAEEHELITMIHGEDLNAAQANRIADVVREAYPRLEIELQDGGQPITSSSFQSSKRQDDRRSCRCVPIFGRGPAISPF